MTRVDFWSEKLTVLGHGVQFELVPRWELVLVGQILLLRWLFRGFCVIYYDIGWFFRPALDDFLVPSIFL